MGISIWQLALILVIVFVVFGAGKLPTVMGDIGRGVRSLKDGLKGDDDSSGKGDGTSGGKDGSSVSENRSPDSAEEKAGDKR